MSNKKAQTSTAQRTGTFLALLLLLCAFASPALAQPVIENPTGSQYTPEGEESGITFKQGHWEIGLGGYLRTGYLHTAQPDDSGLNFIGENNGFALLDSRLGIVLRYAKMMTAKIQFDGAGDRRESVNATSGLQQVRLRDAFVAYTPGPWLTMLVGQSKPPVDIESLLSARDLAFVRRSVVSDGVRQGEGRQVTGTEGLGFSRELGLFALSDTIWFGEAPVGVAYYLALTNGNSAYNTRNDNSELAYYGRLEVHLSDAITGGQKDDSFVVLGGSVGYNENSPIQFPRADLLNQNDLTWGVDLHLSTHGVDVIAQLLNRSRDFPDLPQAKQDTSGLLAQVSYQVPVEFLEFQFGYRFAMLDPFVDESDDVLGRDDQLVYHTIGLGYSLPGIPADIKFNYTLTQEEGDSAIDNDQIEVLVQAIW